MAKTLSVGLTVATLKRKSATNLACYWQKNMKTY